MIERLDNTATWYLGSIPSSSLKYTYLNHIKAYHFNYITIVSDFLFIHNMIPLTIVPYYESIGLEIMNC